MSIPVGTRIGVYEIVGAIGAGGMGEVYRARDPRLGRDVAIKTLPSDFATDADRLRRFEQEARATAALNHPNILAVYDVGTHDRVSYVVAELLEGETLRTRLGAAAASGTQTPLQVRKAIDYATQIARGLAAAHEKGIVHRDLKPENLFVTADGHVKILDFGLAKLVQPSGPADVTVAAGTDPGLVMGTVGYMAPEQVRGLPVDHRADIFAFGAVLYEMLAGRRAFQGATPADTIASIVKDDPPDLPSADRHIPPALARIVDRCLEKTPAARFQSASDLAFALEALSSASGRTEAAAIAPVASRRSRERLAWIAAAALALWAVGASIFIARHLSEAPSEVAPVRFVLVPPERGVLADTAPAVISPDGRHVIFGATVDGVRSLWVRPLSGLTATVLPGTIGAAYPFWSPDSASVAFFAEGKLKRTSIAGGPPVVVCETCDAVVGGGASAGGGAWGADGTIVFAASGVAPLQRVPAAGGTPAAVTTLAEGEGGHRWPWFLPDARRFLYVSVDRESALRQSGTMWIASLDSTDRTPLGSATSQVQYAAGHLLFTRAGTLTAQPFDAGRGVVNGEAVPLVEDLFGAAGAVRAPFSVSETGVLSYWHGGASVPRSSLTWLDRSGKPLGTVGDRRGLYSNLALSADDGHLAVFRVVGSLPDVNVDIWLLDLARGGTSSRLTLDPASDVDPVWSPDGADVFFSSNRDGTYRLYRRAASGAGQDVLVQRIESAATAADISPDGRWLAYLGAGGDIWVLPLTGEAPARRFVATPFGETAPSFSPDGRWLAYQSSESGRPEIHVQPFPSGGSKYVISRDGGRQPRWRRSDGRELFFLAPDGILMAASLDVSSGVRVTQLQALFNTGIVSAGNNHPYAVARDGQRIILPVPDDATGGYPVVVLNWTAGLAR